MKPIWRDIAVFIDASPEGEILAGHAVRLAAQHQAHLVAVYGLSRHDEGARMPGYIRGRAAISSLIEREKAEETRKVVRAGQRFAELTAGSGITSEFRIVWRDDMGDEKVLRALHCDLAIAAHPRLAGLPTSWSAERILIDSGLPVLMIPQGWQGDTIGQKIVIAWNRSREAQRVVSDAMPFIEAAQSTTILTVDAGRDPDYYGDDPGSHLRQHLARHDVSAEVTNVSSAGLSVAETILQQTSQAGADLLVVGAYSRPRASEILFGGTTRSLIGEARIPMLMSR